MFLSFFKIIVDNAHSRLLRFARNDDFLFIFSGLPISVIESPDRGVAIWESKFTQLVQIGKHVFFADEPVDAGGLNKGPGPYDLILAALGACTSMTLRLYATQKNIPVKGIKVSLTHEKVYNEDQIDCVDKNERLDLIQRVITVKGNLTEEQIADLLRVADKCPVHKTMTQPSIIKTTLDVMKV